MHRSSHTTKSKKIQICAGNIHHHKPVSKTSLEFWLRCVPYSTKYYRFILRYNARSGGLLRFVSISTPIDQLQPNRFGQRGLGITLTDSYSFKTTISCLPSVLLKTNLTWSLKTSGIPIPHTYFTKHGSHNSQTYIGLLWLKSMVFDTLDLIAMGWNTLFNNLLKQLPPQLEIAGLLQSSTPSYADSQVNLTWLMCLNCWYIILVYGILEYPYTGLKPEVLLPQIASCHHLTSPYYNFGWLKFNKLPLVYFFQ
jgi:hypothetical protein